MNIFKQLLWKLGLLKPKLENNIYPDEEKPIEQGRKEQAWNRNIYHNRYKVKE